MFSSKLSLKTIYALAIGQFWLHSRTNISSMDDFHKERDRIRTCMQGKYQKILHNSQITLWTWKYQTLGFELRSVYYTLWFVCYPPTVQKGALSIQGSS